MIYLDNAATTRPNERAMQLAAPYLGERFYNPSALYGGGISLNADMRVARTQLLNYVADPAIFSLVFTSGGTEGDNQAIFSAAKRGNAVTTSAEHAAVYECFRELKNRGVEPRFTPVRSDGSVDEERLLSLVDDKTSLVSVIHVNNETGAVNDILSLARAVKKKNPHVLFHSDGVQAYGKIPVRLSPDIDFYTVSAHKIGGLKGMGALIRRKGAPLRPLHFGGGQEETLRSGTENVFGIMQFFFAAEDKFGVLDIDARKLTSLRERLWAKLEGFRRLSPADGTPYILTVSAEGMRGEVLQNMLWARGIVVGTGSACSSKHRFSRVLSACGFGERTLDGALRISFAPGTTEQEVDAAAEAMNAVRHEFGERI